MAESVNHRVKKLPAALGASSLRLVEIWVPDTRRVGFADECCRQSQVVAASDVFDAEFEAFADATLLDLIGKDAE